MWTVKESYECSITGSGRLPIYCTAQLKRVVLLTGERLALARIRVAPNDFFDGTGSFHPRRTGQDSSVPESGFVYDSSVLERDS